VEQPWKYLDSRSLPRRRCLASFAATFADRVWNLRLPRGLQERVIKVDAAVTKLTGLLGRPPTIREVASHLAISEEEVLDAFAGSEARRIRSLDQPVGGGADANFTVGDRVGTEEAGFELAEHRATIDTVLPVLSEREREVIRLRFVDDMTQSQIAERIGHSQMHVSRILRGALARLHEEIAGESEVESDAKRVLPS